MAEAPNRQLEQAKTTDTSITDVQAALRETQARLSFRFALTADHVQVLLRNPSTVQLPGRHEGFVDSVADMFAMVGRIRRSWNQAKTSGVLFRASVGVVAAVAAFATRVRHR